MSIPQDKSLSQAAENIPPVPFPDRPSSGRERPLAAVIPLNRHAARRRQRRLQCSRAGLVRRFTGSEAGLATAEYAITTLAAVGFAALLVAILSSGEVRGLLMSLITTALSFG
jgi:hypothetical protein